MSQILDFFLDQFELKWTKTDLKKSEICPIVCQYGPIEAQALTSLLMILYVDV